MDRVIWIISWILIAIGAIFYFAWGLLYDVWTDIGLYSLSVTLIGFGILGVILAKVKKEES